jgi:hypothetical protein
MLMFVCGLDCETMKDSLEETVGASRPVQVAYDELELRTTALLERYNEYVRSIVPPVRLDSTDASIAGQYIIRSLHLMERHRLIRRGDRRATREGASTSDSCRRIVGDRGRQAVLYISQSSNLTSQKKRRYSDATDSSYSTILPATLELRHLITTSPPVSRQV